MPAQPEAARPVQAACGSIQISVQANVCNTSTTTTAEILPASARQLYVLESVPLEGEPVTQQWPLLAGRNELAPLIWGLGQEDFDEFVADFCAVLPHLLSKSLRRTGRRQAALPSLSCISGHLLRQSFRRTCEQDCE